MKKLVLIITMAACLLGVTGQASAAPTDGIAVTVSLAEAISVDLTPPTWNIGEIDLLAVVPLTPVTATNDGNVAIDLVIKVVNGGGGWTVSGGNGLNTFSIVADNGVPVFPGTSFFLSTSDLSLRLNLSPTGTQVFDLTFNAPNDDNIGPGTAQDFDIVVTASATP